MSSGAFDHDDTIIVDSEDSIGQQVDIFGRRVIFPIFEIYSNPTVSIGDITSRRFSIIDRAVQKARQEIMAQEDASIFAALDAIGDKNE